MKSVEGREGQSPRYKDFTWKNTIFFYCEVLEKLMKKDIFFGVDQYTLSIYMHILKSALLFLTHLGKYVLVTLYGKLFKKVIG